MKTPLSRRRAETYSDLTKDLFLSPINSDVMKKIDEEAVKESIRNLVMTDRGERLYAPDLGCDVRKLLFSNFTPQTKINAESLIRMVIKNHEPRANLITVDVTSSPDDNFLRITIIFNVINKEEPVEFSITLDRVR